MEGDGESGRRGLKRPRDDAGATKCDQPSPGLRSGSASGTSRAQESIYNTLVLLLLRESGAAVELIRMVQSFGASPDRTAAQSSCDVCIASQRTWVCALVRLRRVSSPSSRPS